MENTRVWSKYNKVLQHIVIVVPINYLMSWWNIKQSSHEIFSADILKNNNNIVFIRVHLHVDQISVSNFESIH